MQPRSLGSNCSPLRNVFESTESSSGSRFDAVADLPRSPLIAFGHTHTHTHTQKRNRTFAKRLARTSNDFACRERLRQRYDEPTTVLRH